MTVILWVIGTWKTVMICNRSLVTILNKNKLQKWENRTLQLFRVCLVFWGIFLSLFLNCLKLFLYRIYYCWDSHFFHMEVIA